MIKGCISAILATLPNMLIRLAYGEEGMEFRKNCGKTNALLRFIMNAFVFWEFLALLLLPTAKDHERLEAILFALIPIIVYVVWAVFSRKSIKKQISQLRDQLIQEKQEEERHRKEGIWKCPYCEKMNNATDIICKDCGNYR